MQNTKHYLMMKPSRLILFACLSLLMVCLTCSKPDDPNEDDILTPIDNPSFPDRGFYMGVLPIPANGQDFDESYSQAADHVEFAPVWAAGIGAFGFWDYAETLEDYYGQMHVEQLIRDNGMFPIIHFSFIDKDSADGSLILHAPDDMENPSLSDTIWRDAYKRSVLDVVRAVRPLYLSVGNEVNRWYEQYGVDEGDANGFQHFVSLYDEIYDAVKELSPETVVFCVFAREIVDELREADLDVLDMFDSAKLDILVFTSYPNSVRLDAQGNPMENPHNQPSDIDSDYYSRVEDYISGKPFGFSEVAWPANEFFGGEQGQSEFVADLASRLTIDQGLDLYLLGWCWLHDMGMADDFGLIARNGTGKLAYDTWRSISAGELPTPTRGQSIPYEAIKMTPETDYYPPVLHLDLWQDPVPLPGLINTAGAEDSPFITPDADTFFFFFTPDVDVPPEQQLLDRVTGIWWSRYISGNWTEPSKIILSDDLALDGCPFSRDNKLWFCSARADGYRTIDIYIAELIAGDWGNVTNAGQRLNAEIEIGELHLSSDGNTLYFGTDVLDGHGGYDLWKTVKSDGVWGDAVNLGTNVNTPYNEFLPYVSADGNELWYTAESSLGYPGPAVFRSFKIDEDTWGESEEIISSFAGEPTLDSQGNIYFVHHYFSDDMQMIEADIYIAYRR
ncbi:MAG: hypothetical protein GY839_16210 [candidate division Zixibacteria bacterium]|nr:hypothetical protein [candidate division Zixibacteria bacterium]